MARTAELRAAGINYYRLQQLMAEGKVECVRRGFYQWIGDKVPSDVRTLARLFPDAVFCMQTASFRILPGYTRPIRGGRTRIPPGRWGFGCARA